jgi:hypothetical protein
MVHSLGRADDRAADRAVIALDSDDSGRVNPSYAAARRYARSTARHTPPPDSRSENIRLRAARRVVR